LARALEKASGVPAKEWVNARTSRHSLFAERPQKRASRPSRGQQSPSVWKEPSFTWKPGQKAEVARAVKMKPQRFSAIIHRTRSMSPRVAVQLENAVMAICGRRVPAIEWLTAPVSQHPAFYGKPGKAL
jgi:hypothetical protein